MMKLCGKLPYVLLFIFCWLFLFGSYYLFSNGLPGKAIGLQMRRYVPCALAMTLAVYYWRQNALPLCKLLPHALVACAWILVYPACYYAANGASEVFIDKHFDQAWGAYFFACSALLSLILHKFRGYERFTAFLFGLLHTVVIALPLFQLWYYSYFRTPISENACLAFLQTNREEATEFVLQAVGYWGVAATLLLVLLLLLLFSKLNKFTAPSAIKHVVVPLICCLAIASYLPRILMDTGILESYTYAKQYFEQAQAFKAGRNERLANLSVTCASKRPLRPGSIILVIGESATRDYMSAYDKSLKQDTTPWLRSIAASNNGILFTHAYSSMFGTMPALERALTEKNQYNDLEFSQSISILDIAKKAGYKTYWFSNQGTISDADTPITLVAETADEKVWAMAIAREHKFIAYDEYLLKFLEKVNPAENNFIVMHLAGSHDSFHNRYPASFQRLCGPAERDFYLTYLNSLAYTDSVLEGVYRFAREKLNLQCFVYFSDHGQDPWRKRNPDKYGFRALRIPFFIYLSDEYKSLYPATFATCRAHKDKYFTNDLMYDALCGILQIKSNHYDPTNSIVDPSYKWTRQTLRTNLGKRSLLEDKDEE